MSFAKHVAKMQLPEGERAPRTKEVESPPEMVAEAQNIVAQYGPEITANVAKLKATDASTYAQLMETIKEQYGPAVADIIATDVEQRTGRQQKGEGEGAEKAEQPPAESVEEADVVKERVLEKMAESVGVSKDEAEEVQETSEANEGGPTPEEKASEQEAAAEQAASTLIEDMGASPGVSADKVPIKVNDESMAKTRSAGAGGMVQDGIVYLHPDEYNPDSTSGQKLIAEETVHWVQQQHALTGAGAEVSPMPQVEREAKNIADAYSRGERVEAPKEIMGPDDIAMDTGAAGAEPPSEITLNFGGISITSPMPSSQEKTITINLDKSPVTGMTVSTATITFDDEWKIQSGTVNASFEIGNFVRMSDVSLSVDSAGGVQCNIQGADLTVGDLVVAKMDLNVSSEGITGTATAMHEQVILPLGIVLLEGFVRITLDSEGKISGVGNLGFEIPGIGDVTLNASLDNEVIGGTITLLVTNPLSLSTGVTLKEATLSGNYTRDAFRMSGSARVDINGWAESNITGTFDYPSQLWSASGTVVQSAPLQFGDMEVTGGQLAVTMANGNLIEVGGGGRFSTPHFSGSLGGTYDVGKNQFTGKGTATLLESLPIGDSGATLTAASGSAEIEANELVKLTSSATVELPYKGQPTFRAVAKDCIYDVKEKKFSGSGSLSTLRDLSFSAGNVKAVVEAGASANATVKDNAIEEVTGSLAYKVSDDKGALGSGSFDAQFAGEVVSGTGSFTLDADYGFPDRDTGPVVIKAGSRLGVTVENNAPTEISLESVKFDLVELGSEKTGLVSGTVKGAIALPDFKFTGNGTASVKTGWSSTTDWGSMGIKEGGEVTVDVDGGAIDKVSLSTVGFTVSIDKGPAPLAMEGVIDGTYSHLTGKASGTIDLFLSNPVTLPVTGGELILGTDTRAKATFQENALEELDFDVQADYKKGGKEVLSGDITGGTYKASTGMVSFKGDLEVIDTLEASSADGKWTFKVKEESFISLDVSNNKLTKVTSDLIWFEVWDKEKFLGGKLTGVTLDMESMKISGELDLALANSFTFPRSGSNEGVDSAVTFTVEFGYISGSMTDNTLTEVTADLSFMVAYPGGKAAGSVKGTWNVTDDKFTGDGSVTTAGEYVLAGASSGGDDLTSWQLCLADGASVALDIKDNAFNQCKVNAQLVLKKSGSEVATGNIDGNYLFGDESGYSGNLDFKMTDDFKVGKQGDWEYFITGGSGLKATAAGSQITEASGTFRLEARQGGEPKIATDLKGKYVAGTGLSGSATLEVLKSFPVASQGEYSVLLDTESSGTVTVEENQFKTVGGTLSLLLKKETSFAKAKFKVDPYDFTKANATINGEGSMEIIGELFLGEAKGYKFTLDGGSGIKGKVTDGALDWVEGQLSLKVADSKGPFASIDIKGKYNHGETPTFNGSAKAEILVEKDLNFESGGFKFFLTPSKVSATLTDSDITEVSGEVGIKAVKEIGTITATLKGSAVKSGEKWNVTGTGTASFDGEIKVGGAGGYSFFIQGGTGLTIEMGENKLKKITGKLNGRIDDKEGEFLGLKATVTYTTEEGGQLDVDGGASLLGNRVIYTGGGYEFSLLKGSTEATVKVVKNDLKEVGGSISCKVVRQDNGLEIGGTAEGKWVKTGDKGDFTGSGDLKLLKDITFSAGGFKFDFLKDSGGNAKVKNNKLTELGGELKCVIHDKKGPLVKLTCGGTYDAVNNKVVEAKGSADVLRPIELFGGKITLTEISGHAEIKDNKLVSAGGEATVVAEGLKEIRGKLNFEWSNLSGKDEYWGSAKLFVVVNDRIEGNCSVELKKAGGFLVKGDVTLKITDNIKGEVGIEVDETFDPILNGTITLEGVELIPGRQLFGLDIPLVPLVNIPIVIPVINAILGCNAGLKADLKPVTFGASLGIENFKPKSQKQPNFTVTASVNGGVNFSAHISPYVGLSLGVKGLQAGAAIEGGLKLDIPVDGGMKLILKSSPDDGFSGEFQLGVTIEPSISLTVRPFLFAEIGTMLEHDLGNWDIPLASLFKWEWKKTYVFGDKGGSTKDGADASGTGSENVTQVKEKVTTESKPSGYDNSGAAQSGDGKATPSLGGGSDFGGGFGGDKDGGELKEKMDSLKDWGDKIGKMASLFGKVMELMAAQATLGPLGPLGILGLLVYKIFLKKEWSLSEIKEEFLTLFNLLKEAFDWIWAKFSNDERVKLAIEFFNDPQAALKKAKDKIVEYAKKNVDEALKYLEDLGDAAEDIINDISSVISEAVAEVYDTVSETVEDAYEAVVPAGVRKYLPF